MRPNAQGAERFDVPLGLDVVRLIDLTFLILCLNAVIAGGGVVSMDEAKDHIRQGDVLEWLKLKFPELDVSTLIGPDRTGGTEIVEGLQGLLEGMKGMSAGSGGSKTMASTFSSVGPTSLFNLARSTPATQ